MKDLKKCKKGISVVSLAIIVVVIITIIVVIIMLNRGNKGTDNTQNDTTQTEQKQVLNYETLSDGSKKNTSKSIQETKNAGDVTIEQTQIVYKNGRSKITAKVKNGNTDKSKLSFNIKLISSDGNVLKETTGYVGPIKANEEKYIESNITEDVSNAADIAYEIK